MNCPFTRKKPSGSSSNKDFNNSSICGKKGSGNAWKMAFSTIFLGGCGEEWHPPLSMGFVNFGCKEFLFHSNPLSFLKGVNRLTAPPHENCLYNEGDPIE